MQKSSLEVTDEQSAAVQKTPHRVTLESIKDKIEEVEYYRPEMSPQLTLAIVKMSNGFVVIGESASADPANFNEQLGEQFALENAIRKIWPLEGYRLCTELSQQAA